MSIVLSNEVINKLYKELELQLDNKQFFNAKDYYNTTSKQVTNTPKNDLKTSNIAYMKTSVSRLLDKSYDRVS